MDEWRKVHVMPRAEMLKRVARFKELKGSQKGLPDSHLPESQKTLFAVVGFAPPEQKLNEATFSPVGDASTIEEADVRASVRDLAESWIFDFTKALAQRQAAPAVTLLRALFDQGEHPLRMLSVIARELRLLLLARDCLSGSLAGSFTPRTQYTVFRDRLLPTLDERERDALGSLHPYVLYQCLQNASRTSTAGKPL